MVRKLSECRLKNTLNSRTLVFMALVHLAVPAVAGPTQTEILKLVPDDLAAGDRLGLAVSISGNVALVGPGDNNWGSGPGAAYIFEDDGTGWTQRVKLVPSDPGTGDEYCRWAATNGEIAVVGARRNDDDGSNSGSVYVYVRPQNGWGSNGPTITETVKLVSSDAVTGDQFGIHVAIDGDVIVVGANQWYNGGPGAAYVFVEPAGGWASAWPTMTETLKLAAHDLPSGAVLGHKVAISGDVIAVADARNDHLGSNTGAVFLYERPSGGWDSVPSPLYESAKLLASDVSPNDLFGYDIAMDGDTLIAGMFNEAILNSVTGAAYIFEEPAGGWSSVASPIFETAKLLPSDAALGDLVGQEVAISGDIALVGASYDDDAGVNSGSAYVFVKPSGGWTDVPESVKLIGSDTSSGDRFGSVAVSGSIALVGAHLHDGGGSDSGGAYVFDLSGLLTLTAHVDVKPGSCPNPVNVASRGYIPVSVLGSTSFDTSLIDVTSVCMSRADGVGAPVWPNEGPPGPHSVFEDTGTPFEGPLCDCHDLDGDGIVDLSMKFKTQHVIELLELDDVPSGDFVEITISGTLIDGTSFSGRDCIRVTGS